MTTNNKRSGSPSLEYNLGYKRRPYIQKTITLSEPITHSEPRNVAGDVKRRDDKKVADLPPPLKATLSKSTSHQEDGDDYGDGEQGRNFGSGSGNGNRDEENDLNGDSDENDDVQEEQNPTSEDGLSDGEFESDTSSPWPEGVGLDNFNWENHKQNSRLQPTSSTMIDAAVLELQAIEAARESESIRLRAIEELKRGKEEELCRLKRGTADLDGPGWKTYNNDRKSVGIHVYRLFADGRQVWRYKGYDMGQGEDTFNICDRDRRVEIHFEDLVDAGWRWMDERRCWERKRAPEEVSMAFEEYPYITPLPERLKNSTSESETLAGPSYIDPRDIGRAF